jgi:hypothetical protein
MQDERSNSAFDDDDDDDSGPQMAKSEAAIANPRDGNKLITREPTAPKTLSSAIVVEGTNGE